MENMYVIEYIYWETKCFWMFSEEKCQTLLNKDVCPYFISMVLQEAHQRPNFTIFKIKKKIQNSQFISVL